MTDQLTFWLPLMNRHVDRPILKLVTEEVCGFFGVTIDDLRSGCRDRNIVEARQVFCLALYQHTELSERYIGQQMNRGHCDVIYSIRCAINNFRFSSKFQRKVSKLYSKLMIRDENYVNRQGKRPYRDWDGHSRRNSAAWFSLVDNSHKNICVLENNLQ
jgi:hypothetical protein